MKRRTLLYTILALMGFPVISFIKKVQHRPPLSIKVFKSLLPGEALIHDDFVLFETDAGPVAVSRHCTHLGCMVNFREDEKKFICPCHQSVFGWDGKYVKGPARKDLERFEVKKINGTEGHGYEILVPRSRLS